VLGFLMAKISASKHGAKVRSVDTVNTTAMVNARKRKQQVLFPKAS
jgi:hypothetical protein